MAKILLVDDERHIRDFYSKELADDGHEVYTLSSGKNLLQKIERHNPDAVVLDIRLRGWDGLELLMKIRSSFGELPVVLCSAYDAYRGDSKADKADFYVVKNVDPSELKMAVQKAIGRADSPSADGSPLLGPPSSVYRSR
jgi:CheY-like chemotaxis protein